MSIIFVDVETTGLTPASSPVSLPGSVNGDTTLRLRVATIGYFCSNGGFVTRVVDMDRLTPDERRLFLDTLLHTKVLVGHNLTFDLTWLRHAWRELNGPDVPVADVPTPEYAFDTLLWVRLLRPETAVNTGGFSLANLLKETVGETLDKQFQKPVNWVPESLSPEALEYAKRDVTALQDWLEHTLPGKSPLSERLLEWVQSPGMLLTRELPGMYQVEDAERLNELIETWLQTPNMLSSLSLRGQPFSVEAVREYVEEESQRITDAATALVALEPQLTPRLPALKNPSNGISGALRDALADAFTRRGLRLSSSEKNGHPQIGIKHLRAVGATRNPETLPLYTQWKTINDIKRRITMAQEYARFAEADGRIHPNFSPAAQTGRLTCSEPNMQQVPADKVFRAFVRGNGNTCIVACDVSALDVRVGAALAVRIQRVLRENSGRVLEAVLRENYLGNDFRHFLETKSFQLEQLEDMWKAARRKAWNTRKREEPPHMLTELLSAQEALESEMARTPGSHRGRIGRKSWAVQDALLSMQLENAFHQIFRMQEADGTYSSLRQAFRLGVDIHSWTAARLKGWDVAARFAGCKYPEEYAEANTALKAELGKTRNLGKVANLALMYGMGTEGFLDYCKGTWDMHFIEDNEKRLPDAPQRELALSRARELRLQWLEAYPEIQLFSAVTEIQRRLYPRENNWQTGNGRSAFRTGPRWFTRTLSGRPIYAASKFAALNYPNQGTGSDILLMTKYRLHRDHPEIFDCLINQVHDELVMETPVDKAEEYAHILEATLQACGDALLGPYGVPMKAETVIADVWTKG
jgi:DNA polymerase I - 3''-5'' exonuclease and polymerase domains